MLDIGPNDYDPMPIFKLGEDFFYSTKAFSSESSYIPQSKYQSLKQESLHDKIYQMDINIWQETLQNAILYSSTHKAKSMTASDEFATNNDYEVPPGLSFCVSHLMTLMMYTNLTDLQYNYKKFGCRRSNKNQSLKEMNKMHSEIAIWYKLLIESIYFYGEQASKTDVFYAGMSVPLIFDTFKPEFACPISTTTAFQIAHNFSKGKGIILKMTPSAESFDHYFDVEWFSNFPQEKERLFAEATDLKILDVQYFMGRNILTTAKYVNAFELFSSLFNGHYIFTSKNAKKIKKQQRMLVKLIINYKIHHFYDIPDNELEMNKSAKIPIYAQQLFYNLVHNLGEQRQDGEIYLIKSQYELLNEELKQQLIEFNTNPKKKEEEDLSQFQKLVTEIIENKGDDNDMDHRLKIIIYLREILKHISTDDMYKKMDGDDEKNEDFNIVMSSESAIAFLKLLGFKYEDNSKKVFSCTNDPSIDLINSAKAAFGVYNPQNVAFSKFFEELLIHPMDVKILEEYHWNLSEKELLNLKNSKADEWIYISDMMSYEADEKSIEFKIGICRRVSRSLYTGFTMEINKINKESVDVIFSVMVEEVDYIKNQWNGFDLTEGEGEGEELTFFDDNLLDSVETLTIHFSVLFY